MSQLVAMAQRLQEAEQTVTELRARAKRGDIGNVSIYGTIMPLPVPGQSNQCDFQIEMSAGQVAALAPPLSSSQPPSDFF
jgi:hypothetical protein